MPVKWRSSEGASTFIAHTDLRFTPKPGVKVYFQSYGSDDGGVANENRTQIAAPIVLAFCLHFI